MNRETRVVAAKYHLDLAALYADDGSYEFAAEHARDAARLLQPDPGDDE